jgi:hypothetical protein
MPGVLGHLCDSANLREDLTAVWIPYFGRDNGRLARVVEGAPDAKRILRLARLFLTRLNTLRMRMRREGEEI